MLRHPFYDGRKAEEVPSVGSRMPGTVKPGYGKPKLALASDPLKLTGDSRSFSFNTLGPHDTDSLSPYRPTRATRRQAEQTREIYRLTRFAHKSGRGAAKAKPKLIKIA